MLPSTIYLIDTKMDLVKAWEEVFREFEEVIVQSGEFFSQEADAMVSPANSFGIMDGGLDAAIREKLGYKVQDNVQQRIIERYYGELPVGCAEIIETGNKKWPYLICAPTMRVPEAVAHTLNSYLAFRAVLSAIKRFNQNAQKQIIRSVLCSGFGTGVGKMPTNRCAVQMRIAYNYMYKNGRIPTFDEIHKVHWKMHSA